MSAREIYSSFINVRTILFMALLMISLSLNAQVGNQSKKVLFSSTSSDLDDYILLPVDLSSFDLFYDGESVRLDWETLFESNTSHFGVERSSDGTSWEQIGVVQGTGTSNSSNKYQFEDISPLDGANYYRLNWYDNDGDSWVSDSRSVGVDCDEIKFASDFNSNQVSVWLPSNWEGNISLFDSTGNATKWVYINKSDPRFQSFNIDSSSFVRYWLKCASDGNEVRLFSSVQFQ